MRDNGQLYRFVLPGNRAFNSSSGQRSFKKIGNAIAIYMRKKGSILLVIKMEDMLQLFIPF